MNKTINYILTILLLIIVSLSNIKAQEAEILSIDPSEYPKIKTEFKLIGYDDREVRSFTKQDVKLFDNFTEKTDLTLPVCEEADPTDYSALLILDISNSMDRSLDPTDTDPNAADRISVVMDVVNDWIDLLDGSTSEAALISFAGSARLLQDFTSDKNKLRNGLGQITGLEQWTNYNAAFFMNPSGDSSQSAVKAMRNAKYTPVIIFLTDGQHNAPEQEAFDIAAVEAWAKAIGCHIFVIKIGNENISVSKADLIRMATIQGYVEDYFYDEIYESGQLEEVYDLIRAKCRDLGEDPPCYSYYNAACDAGGDVFMNFPLYNDLRTESVTFTIPPERKPYLEISPRHLRIEAADLDGGSFEQDITITARNHKSNLHGFVSSDSRFDIDWKGNDPIKSLAVDESVIVGISYTPDDSLYKEETLSFEGSACDSLDFTVGAFLMPHPNDIDMGTAMMFVDPIEKDVTELIINRTGVDLLIEEIRIVGDDAADFDLVTSINNFTLPTGEALAVTFSFGPLGMGYRSSTVEVVTADHVYTLTIHGNGEGEPGIASVNPFIFRNTNCADVSRDTVIALSNTGMKVLNITSMEIIPVGSAFTLGTWDKSIDPAGSIDVQVIFNADDSAPKKAVLRIVSDASSNPEYDINLEGTKDSVSFATASNSVDIGDLCSGESVSKTITIEN
ncbi:MAG: VWA domain-containing protein, partial [Chlorobi bacterium]|nr:VWA domain-containing protein [Chlorobiota bacterium]